MTLSVSTVSSSQGHTMDRHSKIPYQNLLVSHHWPRHCHSPIWCTTATMLYRNQKQRPHILGSPHGNSEPCSSHPYSTPVALSAGNSCPLPPGITGWIPGGTARITRGLPIPETLVSNHGDLICLSPLCPALSRLIITHSTLQHQVRSGGLWANVKQGWLLRQIDDHRAYSAPGVYGPRSDLVNPPLMTGLFCTFGVWR